jgi:hypothetical protein
MNTKGLLTDFLLNIIDLPVEILCRIFNYSDTPLNYTNISLVCRHFYNANKMLKETKALQFSKKFTSHGKETWNGLIFHQKFRYHILPNGMLHGKYLTYSCTRHAHQFLCSFSKEIKYDIYEWGVLVKSYMTKHQLG